MIGRLRQLSEPRLGQQAGIEKSQTHVERDILVQWVRKISFSLLYCNINRYFAIAMDITLILLLYCFMSTINIKGHVGTVS